MSAMDQLDDESYNLHPSSEQTGALHDDVKMVLSFDTNADPQVMRSDNFATAAKKQVSTLTLEVCEFQFCAAVWDLLSLGKDMPGVRLHSDSTVKAPVGKQSRRSAARVAQY